MSISNLSIITTHFYDFRWIKCWIRRIRSYTDENIIKEILIVNQDRTIKSRKKLEKLDKRIVVLEYPRSQAHFDHQGHDHAYVMNLAIRETSGDYICIFDSDSHPFSSIWIEKCNSLLEYFDAIVAVDPYALKKKNEILSHPCFMLFNQKHLSIPLSFDASLFDRKIDTGRLIGAQLKTANQNVFFSYPQRGFSNYWGQVYLNCIYHHGKGSYKGADQILANQIDIGESFFKNIVIRRKRYELTKIEKSYYEFRFLRRGKLYRLLHRIRKISSVLLKKLREYLMKPKIF